MSLSYRGRWWMPLLLGVALAMGARTEAVADTAETRDGLRFYEQKIRPLLAEKCFRCPSDSGDTWPG